MYRCQSAYKLVELDAQFHLFSRFRPHTVVDLAAAPGGFAQVALELMHATGPRGRTRVGPSPMVIAVDQRPIEPLPGLVAVRGNILQHQQILQTVQRTVQSGQQSTGSSSAQNVVPRTVDMVLHDGVSVVKGQHAFSVTYAQNQMALSTLLLASKLFAQLGPVSKGARSSTMEKATDGAASPRQPSRSVHKADDKHGTSASSDAQRTPTELPVCFVSKVLRSPHFGQVVAATGALFRHVSVFKPQASRAESQETYVVATHFLPHRWQALVHFHQQLHRRSGRNTAKPQRGGQPSLEISPALFSMPPGQEDCNDVRHMVWNCLGCGRTCMGAQPCAQCGAFDSAHHPSPRR